MVRRSKMVCWSKQTFVIVSVVTTVKSLNGEKIIRKRT